MSKIVNERGSITSDMALRLSRAFRTSPELWLNLQNNYDLWHAANSTVEWKRVQPMEKVAGVSPSTQAWEETDRL
jgi:plasmid maintenance system antidote protein VapI